jgi:hypothetical protein
MRDVRSVPPVGETTATHLPPLRVSGFPAPPSLPGVEHHKIDGVPVKFSGRN